MIARDEVKADVSDILDGHYVLSGIFLCFKKHSRRPRIERGVVGTTLKEFLQHTELL